MLRDPRSSLESKEFLFPGRDAPDKISGGGQSAVAPDTSKICGLTTGTPRLACFLTNANRNACASNCHHGGRLVDTFCHGLTAISNVEVMRMKDNNNNIR